MRNAGGGHPRRRAAVSPATSPVLITLSRYGWEWTEAGGRCYRRERSSQAGNGSDRREGGGEGVGEGERKGVGE